MLLNAIEWGGQLDPNRTVRIAYLRFRRMVLYRIADPGPGFRFEDLTHAAVAYSPENRLQYVDARMEKGLRPGGFGILMAQAMKHAVIAGRSAYLAGRMAKKLYATASSPLEGVSR